MVFFYLMLKRNTGGFKLRCGLTFIFVLCDQLYFYINPSEMDSGIRVTNNRRV